MRAGTMVARGPWLLQRLPSTFNNYRLRGPKSSISLGVIRDLVGTGRSELCRAPPEIKELAPASLAENLYLGMSDHSGTLILV